MTRYFVTDAGAYIGAFDGTYVAGEPDENGEPTEPVYVFPEIPAGAVEVPTPPSHASEVWDFEAEAWDAAHSLVTLKASLKARLDADAEAERLHYITAGAGQVMTYQQKAAEAAACLADPDADQADYPLLAAEIGITAETLAGVATVVHGQHQAWRVIGGLIEGARLNGKKEIDAAPTAEAAQAAFDAVEWPAA